MNSLHLKTTNGTFGELLVVLCLLQYGIQAAPPLKDSGNDLIAVFGDQFRAIQVKTRSSGSFSSLNELKEKKYHLLALVHLVTKDNEISFDETTIYLLDQSEVKNNTYSAKVLTDFKLTPERIKQLFGQNIEEIESEVIDEETGEVIIHHYLKEVQREAVPSGRDQVHS